MLSSRFYYFLNDETHRGMKLPQGCRPQIECMQSDSRVKSDQATSVFASFFSIQYLFGFCLTLTSWACYHGWSVCMTFCLILHLSPVKSNLTRHFLILKALCFLQIQPDPPLLPGDILIASILEKNYIKSPLHHLIH